MFNSNAIKMLLNLPSIFSKTLLDVANNSWWFNLIAVVMAFLVPLQYAVLFLFCLVIVDMVLSLYEQVKTAKRLRKRILQRNLTLFENIQLRVSVIQPNKLGVPIEKLLVYIIILSIFYGSDIMIFKMDPADAGVSMFSLTNGALFLLAGREILSIVGHAFEITGLDVFNDLKHYFKMRQKQHFDNFPNSEQNNEQSQG